MFAPRFAMAVRNGAGTVTRGRIVSPNRSIIDSHIPQSPASMIASNFSTSGSKLTEKKPTKNPPKSPEEPPPMQFSFEGLGLSRNTKIAVLVILSIFGTIETIFWIKWIGRWFSGAKNDESENKA
ncbi:uncharacterized protein GGS22DRAFT_163361 [Annulohypoxylon maeteangense]|uniref:uncharacterized protein n=1 Tax=Annulohypoxylon maeteangense TaxID=1927788 RepID=UPI0020076F51|nr:uncharacterized protein GGS22DRAFT_163361 [Annulohypoxylon maeteangense]KAI0885288.1 hypothetical protein GGS22DRAFT_163361 [Annulohypoxylon maeteangense]